MNLKNYNFYGWETANVLPLLEEDRSLGDPREFYDLLSGIWCEYTCAPRLRSGWSPEDKTWGQCSITSFLVQDLYGGDVYGIPRPGGSFHCYNVIGDCIFDLTSEQFHGEKLVYEGNPLQKREDHFSKQEKYERYLYLRSEVMKKLHGLECEKKKEG